MRILKFRFWKDKKLQGILELKQNNIIDMGWEWDTVDQFTGLLDKLGKEIYEGDILKHSHEFGGFIQVIKWEELEDSEGGNIFGYAIDKCCSSDAEIIGNIYEHPNLLKVAE